ncbi:ABC transporter substrate-binding protein [Paraglaciecola sp. L3A3]|uniref:substrate-binding periplasmic protein n=1 Tax=Paraglaciecola sp. L3A3 TaxID=2686358 RepID=UPI00131EA0ED|nr:hypothetical protein [Paraglaciecola sp. L3A3]
MKLKNALLFIILICSGFCFGSHAEIIKILGPLHKNDASHDYFVHILKRALAVTADQPSIEISINKLPYPGQKRAMKLLESGEFYDVNWSANSLERNEKLIYVPFPLFKGLLGHRGFVITPANLPRFKNITSLAELKRLTICQGRGWPDVKVLSDNGFNITEVTYFPAMLDMVKLARCDAVPLSVLEGAVEVASLSNKSGELIFFNELIISYELVMNFYLPKTRMKLKNRLYKGLLILEKTGEFEKIMRTQVLTRDVMKHLNRNVKQVIELPIQEKHIIEQRQFFIR